MSAEEKPPAPAEPPVEPPKPAEAEAEATTGRQEALNQLRGDSEERENTVRGDRIFARGMDRLGDRATRVNVFQGDITVEGDMVTGRRSGQRRPTRVRLTDEHIDSHIEYVVEPAGIEDLVDIVADTNLGVISGPRRSGRETAALHVLTTVLERARLPRVIYELHGHVLGNGSWRPPVPSCGLLVRDTSGCAAVDDAWLAHAARVSLDNGSFLVVVTGPLKGALATAANRADHVLEDLDVPDPMEVVRLRLAAVPGAERALALPGLTELLDERSEPGFATRVAAALADALRSGSDLAAAIAALRDADAQVREWLGDEPDHHDLAFTMATAVLEESTFLSVADAAVTLTGALSSGAAAPRYRRALLAERGWIEHLTAEDRPPIVRFRHADLRPAVLMWIWHEMDGARPKILHWLGGLADHPDVEVRARAAVAAGILAGADFDHALYTYLRPWAADGSPAKRHSAALALNVVAASHAERVWEHLELWADQVRFAAKRTDLPASAALAACGQIGERSPQRALALLRGLVRHGDWTLLEPVALSAHLLLERGRTAEVLAALVEWSGPDADETARVKALTVFVFIADGGTDDRSPLLPVTDRHLDVLIELWGMALSHPDVRPSALDALAGWMRQLDNDPTTLDAVLAMTAGIADLGHRDFNRIRHALAEWAEEIPSRSAAHIHDELVEAEDLSA